LASESVGASKFGAERNDSAPVDELIWNLAWSAPPMIE
jgi:hypothetical protein